MRAAQVEHYRQAVDRAARNAEKRIEELERQRLVVEKAHREADRVRLQAEQEKERAMWAMFILPIIALLIGVWLGSATRRAADAQRPRGE